MALETQQPTTGTGLVPDLAGQYLTFMLDGETYGLEVLKVQEIIGVLPVTRVPKTPDFIRGVINLRGKVIPILGLRERFGLAPAEDTEMSCIVVVQLHAAGKKVTAGIVVDQVCEVLEVGPEQTTTTPDFGARVDTEYILGMARLEDKVIMFLDAERTAGTETMTAVDHHMEEPQTGSR